MATKKEQRVKLYFKQNPPGWGYHPGMTEDVPKAQAEKFVKQGYAREAKKTLPNDMPGRDELIASGIESLDEVDQLTKADLVALSDVGDAKADKILEYMKGA